jgi:hypothetical protein
MAVDSPLLCECVALGLLRVGTCSSRSSAREKQHCIGQVSGGNFSAFGGAKFHDPLGFLWVFPVCFPTSDSFEEESRHVLTPSSLYVMPIVTANRSESANRSAFRWNCRAPEMNAARCGVAESRNSGDERRPLRNFAVS